MRTISFLFIIFFFLTGCWNENVVTKNYERVTIISLDTTLSCEDAISHQNSPEINNSECFVIDTLGRPLFQKTNQITLNDIEKKWVINFFETYKDTLTGTLEGSDNGTMLYFRDAICFFEKESDTIPSKIYWISFPSSKIAVKGQRQYLPCTLDALNPLAKIFIRHRLKNTPKFNKSWM
jgi:hypothetical protein